MIGLVAVTTAGRRAAAELAAAWGDETRMYDGPAAHALPAAFAECAGVVAFLATGAAVRLLAPHLDGKYRDPGVVCVDEARRHAVALLGGHAGGANALAARVAAVLGCVPVVTTGSDASGLPALDALGWPVEGALAAVGRALLDGAPVRLVADAVWPLPALPDTVGETGEHTLLVTDRLTDRVVALDPRTAVLRPPSLVVGVGASRGVDAEEVLTLVDGALADARLSPLSVRCLATLDAKADEPGVVAAAAARGWPIVAHPAAALAAVGVPNPSEPVRDAVRTPSVAEAAALLGLGNTALLGLGNTSLLGLDNTALLGLDDTALLGPASTAHLAPAADLVVPKRKSAAATVAVARHAPRGRLALVGLGPGARDLLPPRAVTELRRAAVVVGLDQYVAQVRDLLRPGTRVLVSPLGREEERARAAVEEARRGHAVALVGSGDAGIYAMAGPALALAGSDIDVVGVPGITAALAAAALLGAPLGHDHAVISLSDLHTPWEAIERRVRAAAAGDFVVAFYNPRSRERRWQLPRALDLLAAHRAASTPVGVVADAGRRTQRVTLTTLGGLHPDTVDMTCVVLVGSTNTRVVAGRMVTPRGYSWLPP